MSAARTRDQIIGREAPTYCVDGPSGAIYEPESFLAWLEAGWIVSVDGVHYEVIDNIFAQTAAQQRRKGGPSVIVNSGKRAPERLAIHKGRVRLLVGVRKHPVHTVIVVHRGSKTDLVEIATEQQAREREHVAALAAAQPGQAIDVNGARYNVIGIEDAPAPDKPRGPAVRCVYLRGKRGQLGTLWLGRDGLVLLLGSKRQTVRSLSVRCDVAQKGGAQ